MKKEEKAKILFQYIKKKYKGLIEKHYSHSKDPFKLLITVLLSQRTREELTIEKSKFLFEKLRLGLDDFLKMDEDEIAELIKPVGFYREKAKRIKEICKMIKEKYKGKVPETREQLLLLPGIGKKSADVVLNALGKETIAIDVHVKTITKRLGLTKANDYDEIQEELHRLFKPKERKYINLGLVLFGKEICKAKPKCYVCPFNSICDYYKAHRKP